MAELLFFASAVCIVISALVHFNRTNFGAAILLFISTLLYAIFCFVGFGKIEGFIPSESISTLISQQGYDPSRLPVKFPQLIKIGLIGGIGFNIFTAIWIICRGGIWKYVLISIILFCILGLALGPFWGLNPIYSLFGLCCGFMAAVAWVLGLTYVQFCVIGNIYVPAIIIIIASIFIVKSSLQRINLFSLLLTFFGAIQILGVFGVLWHYWGGFNYAFYQCVKDLKAIAKTLGTTYEAVNIYIYVVIIPLILLADILVFRCLTSRTK